MDDDGGLGIRNWPFYEQQMKGSLGLQLMSTVPTDRDTMPLVSNGGAGVATFLHHHRYAQNPNHHHPHHPEPPTVPMEFVRESWIHHTRDNKSYHHHVMSINPNFHHHHHQQQHHHHHHILPVVAEPAVAHKLQMLHPPEPPPLKEEDSSMIGAEQFQVAPAPLKKRGQGRPSNNKPSKPKKPKKPRDKCNGSGLGRGKGGVKKNTVLVINGVDLDLSGMPTPVCSCAGTLQQCYRWGVGGWQSACCTTSISMYPLPMSTKRRGARIAGRKMSQGAFKKVLEKLAGEGHNLLHPIDLRPYWAKHGTNKFVTIR